jgi:hypothetical protein
MNMKEIVSSPDFRETAEAYRWPYNDSRGRISAYGGPEEVIGNKKENRRYKEREGNQPHKGINLDSFSVENRVYGGTEGQQNICADKEDPAGFLSPPAGDVSGDRQKDRNHDKKNLRVKPLDALFRGDSVADYHHDEKQGNEETNDTSDPPDDCNIVFIAG